MMDETNKTHVEGEEENKYKSESKELAAVESKSRTR